MPKRVLRGDDDLDLDLRIRTRQGFIARHLHAPRLSVPLKQLGARGAVVPDPPSGSRGAVVKIWRVGPTQKASLGSNTQRHLSYLGRDGKGIGDEPAPLFSEEGKVVDPKAFAQASDGDLHQIRFVISLLDAERVDMTRFVRRFMTQMQEDVRSNLDWVAAVHHDTAHTHAHVLVRGRLGTGEPLYLTKHYFTHGMRYRAMGLATDMLGREGSETWTQSRRRTETLETWVTSHVKASKGDVQGDQPKEISPAQARALRAAFGRLPKAAIGRMPRVNEWRQRRGEQSMETGGESEEIQYRITYTDGQVREFNAREFRNALHVTLTVPGQERTVAFTEYRAGGEWAPYAAVNESLSNESEPRAVGTLFRLTFPAGNQVLRSERDLTDDEANAASEIEVSRESRWEQKEDGSWLLTGRGDYGQRVALGSVGFDPQWVEERMERDFAEPHERDTFDQEFDHDESPRHEGETSAEQTATDEQQYLGTPEDVGGGGGFDLRKEPTNLIERMQSWWELRSIEREGEVGASDRVTFGEQEGETSSEQAPPEPPSSGFTQRLRDYLSRAREMVHGRDQGQGIG